MMRKTSGQLFRGIPAGTNRDRLYYWEDGSPLAIGSVVRYEQGQGDGRDSERFGFYHAYRYHGVVTASGIAELFDAEFDVWRRVAWATFRPATAPEVWGHTKPAELTATQGTAP